MFKRILGAVETYRHSLRVGKFRHIGSGVVVKKGTFSSPEKIALADYVYIGPGSFWDARGGIEIGEGTIIAPRSTLISYNHNYLSVISVPYDSTDKLAPIRIGKGTWVGINVSITAGVTIGDGCIIAMGSVVTKDIPSYTICGGNPCKVIKLRENAEAARELIDKGSFHIHLKVRGHERNT
jgi:maltose O-acetyltransferase